MNVDILYEGTRVCCCFSHTKTGVDMLTFLSTKVYIIINTKNNVYGKTDRFLLLYKRLRLLLPTLASPIQCAEGIVWKCNGIAWADLVI